MLDNTDLVVLNEFKRQYPQWWWRLGWCDLSRDFTCGPQDTAPEAKYIRFGNAFDDGFSCDSRGSFADAIREVMKEIENVATD